MFLWQNKKLIKRKLKGSNLLPNKINPMSFKLQMSQVEEKRNLQSEQTYNTFSSEHEGPAQRFLF